MTEQQRKVFEAWYNDEYVRPIIPADRTEGGYQHPDAQAAWDAWQAALSHAEGEAVGSLAIDKGGSELFRATVAMQDLDPGMYDLYTHPAPQVAVPEPVGWVKWFDDEPSFQPRDALMPEDAKQHGWQLVGLMRSMNAPTAPAGEQPVSDPDGLPDRVLMPRALTAENGAKTALSDEFFVEFGVRCARCGNPDFSLDLGQCAGCQHSEYEPSRRAVPWTTIKRIYSRAVELLGVPAPDEREIAALLERIVPRIDPQNPKPLDETEHCCECTLYYERERIHGEIARLRKLGGNHD